MYDAIVVGARVAGATTALQLARRGHRVLLLDKDEFPSDMPVSTHMVWHGGVAAFDRLGVTPRLEATGCPPMSTFNLDLGDFVLRGEAPPADGSGRCFAPRRHVLDSLLVAMAMEHGAEFRAGSTFQDVVRDGERVVGVTYVDEAGAKHEERARLVVGADGTNSAVAKAVHATATNELPRLQGTFWAYFSGLPLDDMEFYSRPGRMVYSWYTNDGLTLAGICCRYDDFQKLRGNPESSFHSEVSVLAPTFDERVRSAKRETNWVAGSTHNFVRQAAGPGWALVGDAGMTMDPITAWGITNAVRDAESLGDAADAALSGRESWDTAMARHAAARDERALPLFGFTSEMAKLDPPPQPIIDLFVGMKDSQEDASAYFGVFAQSVPVQQFFAPENTDRLMKRGAAALGRA
jgi:2-polyprenyl-6-methoxyphenol hydroxylase-like FAD-dependent oxidoreductase